MNAEQLMDAAIIAARLSPSRIRRVGAVLVARNGDATLTGCNTFPHGVRNTEQRHLGNGRFVWMEHAERNAIYAAAKAGVPTDGATLATTFFPCTDCARAIVQSGIRHLFTLPPDLNDPAWGESFVYSRVILDEAGIAMHFSSRDPATVHADTMASTP